MDCFDKEAVRKAIENDRQRVNMARKAWPNAVGEKNANRLNRYRWRVELFLKRMKQHLNIKEFFGHNENAIQIQIYTAISAYCIVTIAEHRLNLGKDLYGVLRGLQSSL